MKHVIQQLEAEIKSIDNLIRHIGDRRKVAQARYVDLGSEIAGHTDTLASLADQKTKLGAAITGIKSL